MEKIRFMILLICLVIFMQSTSNRLYAGNDCPQFPDGLSTVEDLEWQVEGEIVRLSVSFLTESPHKRTWLDWDIRTNQLEVVIPEGTLEAVLVNGRLEFADFYYNAVYPFRNFLELSPSLTQGIYINEYYQDRNIIFAIENIQSEITYREIDDASSNNYQDVLWLSDNQVLIVTEGVYGSPNYAFLLFCFDGTCFEDFADIASTGYIPAISPDKERIAFGLKGDDNKIVIYNATTLEVARIYDTGDFVGGTTLRWSSDSAYLYYMGREGTYQLNLENGEVTKVTDVRTTNSLSNWLIDDTNRLIIEGGLFPAVHCY